MPTYDFKCNVCGQAFEKFTSGIIETADKVCPQCGSQDVTQQYKSSPAVHTSGFSCDISSSGFG